VLTYATVAMHAKIQHVYFIYLLNLGCNHTTAEAENTIQYMHTWILKDECVATYLARIKQQNASINTMSVHGIINRSWNRILFFIKWNV